MSSPRCGSTVPWRSPQMGCSARWIKPGPRSHGKRTTCAPHTDDLLLQLVTLHERVRQAAEAFYPAHAAADTGSGRSTDIDVIREQTQQLVASLQENKQAEAKLIMESINTDIGVGD